MTQDTLSILFAGGGTGGHLLPGIALAKALQSQYPQTEITFVVPGKPVDRKIMSATDFRWYCDPMRAIPRKWEQGFDFTGRFIRSMGMSLRVFRKHKPDIIVGLGGYGAFSAGIMAKYRNIPMVLFESNRVAGKVVRWLARWSKAIYSNGEVAGVADHKVKITGIPIREDLLISKKEKSQEIITILVMGGSQGARCINQAMIQAAPRLASYRQYIELIHLCGTKQEELKEVYRQYKITAQVDSFCNDMGSLYRRTDIAVCRAGGSTLAELTAIGIPSILIPYAHAAHGHQEINARAMEKKKAAIVMDEKELSGMADVIIDLVSDRKKLRQMAVCAGQQGKPKASVEIINEIMTIVGQ